MAIEHDVLKFTDLAAQIEAWKERFVSEVGIVKYRRAAAWAMDETAKHAAIGIRSQFDKHLKSQVPWTKQAVQYRRSGKAGLNSIEAGEREIFSSVYVMPKQSAYLKYLFGIGDNVRLPGDVGLAQDHILVPFWQNIKETQGVQPTRYGGVPSGFLARLRREVETGERAPARRGAQARSRWTVFCGPIKLHGQSHLAYVARPPRVVVDEPQTIMTKNGPKTVGRKVVSQGVPRILFLAVPRATYKPTLEKPWQQAVEAAAARIPEIMQAQLSDNVRHMDASRAAAENIIASIPTRRSGGGGGSCWPGLAA